MSGKYPPVICSIFAKNYLAFARTLFASFLDQHPDGKCYGLIIDDYHDFVDPEKEQFEIITPKMLEIPRLTEFCFKYNITELSTAFKPYLLQYLIKTRNLEKLLYLDPDILVTGSLDGLFKALDHHDRILTPHLDIDYPDDGSYPDDGHVLSTGVYNLGFIGIKPGSASEQFLQWWAHKLYNKCIILPRRGYFVDQRFIDLAVELFPGFGIIRHPGYNAAYWNLHSRTISTSGSRWYCNGEPLYFYHFSNYKPEKPDAISGHQWRYTFGELPGLEQLFKLYRELLGKNGYDTSRKWPYSYGKFLSGTPIRDHHRISYRYNLPAIGCDDPFSLRPAKLLFAGAHWLLGKVVKRITPKH